MPKTALMKNNTSSPKMQALAAFFLLTDKTGGFRFFHAYLVAAADLPASMLRKFFVEVN